MSQPPPWAPPPAGPGEAGPSGWYVPPGHQPTDHPAPGYPTPGYPAAGYPAPGYPAPGRGTNGFAITALVLGLAGFLLITIPISVVFGCIALSQIGRTAQSGRGLAVAGLALSGAWVVLLVVATVAGVAERADRDDSGTVTAGATVAATALRVGDCISELADVTILTSLPAVPCDAAHKGEVFAVFDLPAGPYPGESAVDAQVQATCNTRLDAYAPSTIGNASVGLYFVYPLERNWRAGDREVVCIATSTSGRTTGSIRDR